MQKTIQFIVSDSSHTPLAYEIKFPNAGQLLQIEEMKVALSKNYREMAMKGTILADLALDIIDMQSHLTILCPTLLTEMKTPLLQMDIADLIQLRDAYEKQFSPWWNSWIRLIGKVPEAKVEKNEKPEQQLSTTSEPKKADINKPGAENVHVDLS